MRLWCWYCHKSVTNELPDDALFRAIAICPECIDGTVEADAHPICKSEIKLLQAKLADAVYVLKHTGHNINHYKHGECLGCMAQEVLKKLEEK